MDHEQQSVRLVGEYRGKEALFSQQSPQVLQALRGNAVIQSTESSNRIEGVVAPAQRIRDLVAGRTEPANRSEQEIAGYRDVLNTVHANFAEMSLGSGTARDHSADDRARLARAARRRRDPLRQAGTRRGLGEAEGREIARALD